MDNVLFVVNMQNFFVGKKRNKDKFSYNAEDLIAKINKRIAAYQPEEVFYIVSVGKGLFKGLAPKPETMDAELSRDIKVKSKNIYQKSKPDFFSNDALTDFIRARNVKEVEFVGIDTSTEFGASALTANEFCMVIMAPDKQAKFREKIRKTRITYKHDMDE